MIATRAQPNGLVSPAPQTRPASQAKLAFKRYVEALAVGDAIEAADAFASWQRLAGIAPTQHEEAIR